MNSTFKFDTTVKGREAENPRFVTYTHYFFFEKYMWVPQNSIGKSHVFYQNEKAVVLIEHSIMLNKYSETNYSSYKQKQAWQRINITFSIKKQYQVFFSPKLFFDKTLSLLIKILYVYRNKLTNKI